MDKPPASKIDVKPSSTVTFEATPRISEKIAVAQSVGTLSLSLRSIADTTAELERVVASGQVKVPAGANPAQERQMLLAVANQPMGSNTTFTTGGDVSRFQRRTVPQKPAAEGSQLAMAGAGRSSGASIGIPGPVGPVVRVSRGNNVTVVPVGAR